MADDDANEVLKPFHYEDGVPVFDVKRVDRLERRQNEAEVRDTKYKDEQLRVNKWMMRFTGALVLFAAVSGIVSGVQAYIAGLNAKAARDNAAAAKAQAEAARQTVTEMQKSGSDTHDLAVAGGKQADAAKTQADSTKILAANQRKALDASVAATQLDQRPWVYTTQFVLSNEPDVDKQFWITAYLANNGKTPALEVHTITQVSWWHTEPPSADFDQRKANISNLIPPSASGSASEESEHETMNTRQIAAYRSGPTRIYFRMKTYYRDIFKQWHWTTTCVAHTYNKPLTTFDLCDHGNDVGEGPQATKP